MEWDGMGWVGWDGMAQLRCDSRKDNRDAASRCMWYICKYDIIQKVASYDINLIDLIDGWIDRSSRRE